MRFKFLTGDMNWQTYGGSFVSKKLNNGEFDYWLVLKVDNWNEYERNPKETYLVSLLSVSPSEAGQDKLDSAFRCCGLDSDEQAELRKDSMVQVESLVSYGVYAQLWTASGNNLRKLLKVAHEQADIASSLYGFYMDRPQNRIGTDGWEMQRGNITAGLGR